MLLRSLLHSELPVVLRVWLVVPATIALVIVGGLTFTLPPGPLCDEGMVLFMEGGCDWGDSNIFFFSKLGLLVALNLTFVIAWRLGVRRVTGFLPHLLVLAFLVIVERSGGRCDTYYSHPNGSIGQMALECIGFALLGMSYLTVATKRSWVRLAVAVLGWNACYVSIFYVGLTFTNHWTWLHTFFIFGALVLFAIFVRLVAQTRQSWRGCTWRSSGESRTRRDGPGVILYGRCSSRSDALRRSSAFP
jgi:hypothetical protein